MLADDSTAPCLKRKASYDDVAELLEFLMPCVEPEDEKNYRDENMASKIEDEEDEAGHGGRFMLKKTRIETWSSEAQTDFISFEMATESVSKEVEEDDWVSGFLDNFKQVSFSSECDWMFLKFQRINVGVLASWP